MESVSANLRQSPGQDAINALLVSLVQESLSHLRNGHDSPAVDAQTRLIGRGAVLDSLGLVTLIVDLEQQVGERFGVPIILADDRAMSQEHSPFRSVGSLAGYVHELIGESLGRA